MKKLAIGCLVLLILLAVAAAVGSYLIYQKVTTTVGEFAQLSQVPELERSVRNRASFVPPASGELTESQLQRFLRVQEAVRSRLGARAAEFEQNYRTLLEKEQATALDIPQLVRAYRDVAVGYVDAKRAQVDALNETGFSLDEYRWTRMQVYAALGVPMMDLDVAQIIDDVQKGRPPDVPERVMTIGPSGRRMNQGLVERHRKFLEDNAALAFFGL